MSESCLKETHNETKKEKHVTATATTRNEGQRDADTFIPFKHQAARGDPIWPETHKVLLQVDVWR